MQWIINKWYSNHPFCYLLIPLSALYRSAITFRQFVFRIGLKKSTRFPVPVIVVGNITVGGTGKTPFVIWLANFLCQQGFHPGIVSRGYGGKVNHYPQYVTANSDPNKVGDEAVLLATKTNCPVVVDPNRVVAVQTLLNNNQCDIVISDDGLQHYALARELEIILIDGERNLGNQFCLPAGPLREPIKRLKAADFVVANGKQLADTSLMELVPGKIYNMLDPAQILELQSIKQLIHAVTGIGNPQRFFQTLKKLGIIATEHVFPDHYLFKEKDFNFAHGNDIVIITEKDAVKCKAFADKRFWCLSVEAKLENEFIEKLRSRVCQTQRGQILL